MFILKILFYPFSLLWQIVIFFRNFLYDKNILTKYSFEKPYLICVGNLSVGGTGKTPMTEFLAEYFAQKYPTAILSRGYGRHTKGFLEAKNGKHSAFDTGDEPFQYLLKFGEKCRVFVGEDRVSATKKIADLYPETAVLLLDDAFQHRRIWAKKYLILTEYSKPFFNDDVVPAGFLRESPRALRRADAVIVSKCPENITSKEKENFIRKIRAYNSSLPVFFSYLQYADFKPLNNKSKTISPKIILFTGIANPAPIREYLEKKGLTVIKHLKFPDHYFYKAQDIQQILRCAQEEASFLTTEKDLTRLISGNFLPEFADFALFSLPIKVDFAEQTETFEQFIGEFPVI
jgi:tetraacyldisaccharide 4'-kinase